ncbi:MAG: peptidase M13 [Cellulomonadaceae bacterium]|nr:peptidase M13 [Cellulomonadaceae bacterium]
MTRPSGIDLTQIDAATRPQDDLFRHVNGKWLASHVIPADRSIDGAFRQLRDASEEHVKQIIEDLSAAPDLKPGSINAKIGDLYSSFMDTSRIETLGTSPITDEMAAIAAAPTAADLVDVLGSLQRVGAASAFGFYVDNDADNPEIYKVYLYQGGLGLPDEAYYREDQHTEIRDKYAPHLARMLRLGGGLTALGLPDNDDTAAAIAQRIVALETRLAAHHWDVVACRDVTKTHNPMTLGQLAASAPGFDFTRWVHALAGPEGAFDQLIVSQPSYFTGFAALWASENLDDWKAWGVARVIIKRAAYLTDAIVQANFDFYGRALTGAQEVRERWKRGVAVVESVLGEAVGQEYVARHFPPTHKQRMDDLVANLTEAYRQSISNLDWMTPATREKALAKLDKFTPKIGYPTQWRDYTGLDITADNLIDNIRQSDIFDLAYELNKIGKPLDRDEWFMTPQTVNAYYNPGMNEIVFPAAILQPPFFDADADDAVNYGGIGGVIGHEIGHGFDDQGSEYDGDGKLADWWTPEDRTEFEVRTKALIDQYDAYTPVQFKGDGPHVNGALTLGENIGDLGGLSIAIKAYRIALAKEAAANGQTVDPADVTAPIIDGLTGGQRVFYGWAQAWQTKGRDEEVKVRIATDPHSPDEFRCNGVIRNIPEFYEAFDVTEGDALYLPENQRVHIW